MHWVLFYFTRNTSIWTCLTPDAFYNVSKNSSTTVAKSSIWWLCPNRDLARRRSDESFRPIEKLRVQCQGTCYPWNTARSPGLWLQWQNFQSNAWQGEQVGILPETVLVFKRRNLIYFLKVIVTSYWAKNLAELSLKNCHVISLPLGLTATATITNTASWDRTSVFIITNQLNRYILS